MHKDTEEPTTVFNKRAVFQELLSQGLVNLVVLKQEGVEGVEFKPEQEHIMLKYHYSYMSPVPINIFCDDKEVTATLSFGGVPRTTHVPWSAVVAIQGERAHVMYGVDQGVATEEKPEEEAKRSHLRSV